MSKAKTADTPTDKSASKKKLFLLVGLVVLLGGGGAGGWFSGAIPKLLGRSATAAEAGHGSEHGAPAATHAATDAHGKPVPAAGGPLFMELPDIVANLNAGPRRASFVKLKTRLELSRAEDQQAITAAMPRVLDLFQGYLRELRPEELRGSAGTYRLREELLARTNLAAPPARVTAVLFTEVLVQ